MRASVNTCKPSLTEVLKKEGVELRQRGKYLWAPCPLHNEKTPSFKVDPEKQVFHCFGCGEGGDVITFIKQYKGLSFTEALSYLGLNDGKPARIGNKEAKGRALVNDFNKWRKTFADELYGFCRAFNQKKLKVKTIEEALALAPLYHQESLWEHWLDVLEGRDEEAKLQLFKEVRHVRP